MSYLKIETEDIGTGGYEWDKRLKRRIWNGLEDWKENMGWWIGKKTKDGEGDWKEDMG